MNRYAKVEDYFVAHPGLLGLMFLVFSTLIGLGIGWWTPTRLAYGRGFKDAAIQLATEKDTAVKEALENAPVFHNIDLEKQINARDQEISEKQHENRALAEQIIYFQNKIDLVDTYISFVNSMRDRTDKDRPNRLNQADRDRLRNTIERIHTVHEQSQMITDLFNHDVDVAYQKLARGETLKDTELLSVANSFTSNVDSKIAQARIQLDTLRQAASESK